MFPYPPETTSIAAFQRVVPFSELLPLLQSFEAGQVQFGEHVVTYYVGETDHSPREVQPYHAARTNFSPRVSEYRRSAESQWSELRLWTSGDQIQHYFREQPHRGDNLDHELRTLPRPLDGLQGLAQVFVRDIDKLGIDHSTSFGVVAPFEARVDPRASRFREILKIRVIAGTELVRDACDVAYTGVASNGMPLAERVEIPSSAWQRMGEEWVCDVAVPAPPTTSIVILLRVGPYCIDRLVLSNTAPINQNASVDAYRVLDPELEILQEGLATGGRAKAKGFEQAVSRLLTLCGFRVDFLGADGRLNDAADCVAYADEERAVLVVDCTLGAIDSGGKLGKLHNRAREVGGALPGHVVFGVVATMSFLEDVATQELNRAATDRVIILTQADYTELLELAVSNRPLSQCLALIRSRVPPQPVNPALLRGWPR